MRKKYVRNTNFFDDRFFMRTPYACIQDDDDSFLFLEAKNLLLLNKVKIQREVSPRRVKSFLLRGTRMNRHRLACIRTIV